ncbi:MAG TPA: PilZ domain-containing protein [Candidatus Dormibacteraeota bacterium]|nr:PilZ domain-containing protein [Candidatus Dormibacteraeota bacterium]
MSDRRRYPRVNANILCRPAGLRLTHHKRNARDVSLGGMRGFSDERFEVASQLDLDVFLADGSTIRCWAHVVWLVELEPGVAARFDVGLKFTDMAEPDVQRLASVLSREPADQTPT